ncbi:MAG: MFS transporter [Candidatus Andeanibacterium colombiense]|uniref:MFS transporter n=1 Tax=Candidatus Andeanibacterium colombiense TaxID=3121345 RepID=A0AAJ5XC83_9SPHN|nr:MAG: MFS transporter [Sphingomonadaceae bacterium]
MAEQAATGRTLDVAEFLGGLKITRFHVFLIVISSCVTFFDGLDFSLMTFTLPYIRDEMHLTNAMMGVVSSSAFLGQMIGSLAGSYIADVIGRRPVILLCTVLGAVLTFVTGYANTPEMLIVLRFLGGLAIGGLLAPAWSLNIEAMPKALKATSVTIIMLGFSLGGAAAGQVTNLIAPQHGWEGVFFFCGVMTFALALVLQFTLPESARWMVAKGRPVDKIMPLLDRFQRGIADKGYSEVILSDEQQSAGEAPWTKLFELFKGPLKWITPIIWFTYFCSSFAIYIKTSFGLQFLEKLGIPLATGTNLGSIGGLIGAVGGVFLLGFTEKRGPIWIALAPLLGVPLALLIGSGLILDGPWFIPVILLGSIMIGIGHAAVISITSIYYASSVRSTGGGWASFMAKFAAVAAPNVAANLFLADKAAVLDGYSFTALCLAGVVLGIIALAFFARRLPGAQPVPDADPEPAIA